MLRILVGQTIAPNRRLASQLSPLPLQVLIAFTTFVYSLSCPEDCIKHGSCNLELGRCDCLKGWQGESCSIEMKGSTEELKNISRSYGFSTYRDFSTARIQCFNSCNGKGYCHYGVCHCETGYFGTDCALSMNKETGKAEVLANYGYKIRKKPPKIYCYELPPNISTWYYRSRLDRPLYTLFWERLLSAGVRVADGNEADWFFVPVQVRNPPESRLLLDTLGYINRTWPWWNKTGGARHLIIHTGDFGSADIAASIAEEAKVRLANVTWLQHWGLHVTNELAGWKPAHIIGKDIVIPYMVRPHQVKAFGLKVSPLHPLYVQEMKPRNDVLFFSGRICGDRWGWALRLILYRPLPLILLQSGSQRDQPQQPLF